MNRHQFWIFAGVPLIIWGSAYALTTSIKSPVENSVSFQNRVYAEQPIRFQQQSKPTLLLASNVPVDEDSPFGKEDLQWKRLQEKRLQERCEKRARMLQVEFGERQAVVIHSPYVIAGEYSTNELDNWHQEFIKPGSQALHYQYFETLPDRPITVLLFATQASYEAYSLRVQNENSLSMFGYYKPSQRTLVINAATGSGTLLHELTHALIDFDFPKIPDWFNEGLSSLHEESSFETVEDHLMIRGRINWRLEILQQQIQANRLRSVAELLRKDDFRHSQIRLNYAHARFFCMYLQEKELLKVFYQRYRNDFSQDKSGENALLGLFPNQSWEEIDHDFQRWVLTLKWHDRSDE